jgi:hypothetical protein
LASARGSRLSDAAQDLLEPARQMRWRVPELALMLSDRAVAEARRTGDRALRLRAEALALFSSNRLGRGVQATARAIVAVREAEKAGDDIAADLRVELACCARSAGSHEVALRVLQPVLEREHIEPTVRADALLELVASLSVRRGESERVEALDEAERLYTTATDLNRDTSRLLRARVLTARACHHRRDGDFEAAVEVAGAGLELLAGLGDPAADSGEIHARLVLERVHSLLDLGRRAEAVASAAAVLHQPVRAASAGPSGWLRLALATRVHLPEGGHSAVVLMLNDAAAHAERHKLGGLQAEALSTLSHVHERCAEFPEALRCLRGAYAAERRWRSAVQTARIRLLEEFPLLAGNAEVPKQRSRHADSSMPGAEAPRPSGSPKPPEAPRSTEAPKAPGGQRSAETPKPAATARFAEVPHSPKTPKPAAAARSAQTPKAAQEPKPAETPDSVESQDAAQFRHRIGEGNARDAARRLMEALTNRAAEQGEGDETEQASSQPTRSVSRASRRRAAHEPTDLGSPPQADEPAAVEPEFGARREKAESTVVDWTDWLPRLGQDRRETEESTRGAAFFPGEQDGPPRVDPGGEGFPFHDPAPSSRAESNETPAFPAGAAEPAFSREPIDDPGDQAWGPPEPAVSKKDAQLSFGRQSESWSSPDGQHPAASQGPSPRSQAPQAGPPDVTTIMPVIAVAPEPEPEPAGWPSEPAEQVAPAPVRDAPESPLWHENADTERAARSSSSGANTETDADASRRSRSKSLAEIRASLQLVQERVGTPGSRPAAEAGAPSEPERPPWNAGQQHGQRRAADSEIETGEKPHTGRHEPLQGLPSVRDESQDAVPDGDVGLADLLAEALVAYENGRRDEGEQESRRADDEMSRSRDAGSHSAERLGTAAPHPPSLSTEDDVPRARHRRPAIDPSPADTPSWIPRRY